MPTFRITPKVTIPLNGGIRMERTCQPIDIPVPFGTRPFVDAHRGRPHVVKGRGMGTFGTKEFGLGSPDDYQRELRQHGSSRQGRAWQLHYGRGWQSQKSLPISPVLYPLHGTRKQLARIKPESA